MHADPRSNLTSAIDVYPGEIVAPRACWIARDSYGLPVVRPAPYGQMNADDVRALLAETERWMGVVARVGAETVAACGARLAELSYAGQLVSA